MLQVRAEVQAALDAGGAVVALESTVIAHGLPYPENLETAQALEAAIRERGAVPATIAILDGVLRVGLDAGELTYLARQTGIHKVSRRDIPVVVAQQKDGATTVAATMIVAAMAGIRVFATGGIGGVHRGHPFDISADLPELAQTPLIVVCSGAKAILDLPLTLEWLETHGVPVLGYGTDTFPAFYVRSSGLPVDARVDTPQQVAAVYQAKRQLGLAGGVLVGVPVPLVPSRACSRDRNRRPGSAGGCRGAGGRRARGHTFSFVSRGRADRWAEYGGQYCLAAQQCRRGCRHCPCPERSGARLVGFQPVGDRRGGDFKDGQIVRVGQNLELDVRCGKAGDLCRRLVRVQQGICPALHVQERSGQRAVRGSGIVRHGLLLAGERAPGFYQRVCLDHRLGPVVTPDRPVGQA